MAENHRTGTGPGVDPTIRRLRMIDVGEKAATKRRALARGRILMSQEAFEAIAQGTNPKGDVLAQAEVAGILAAKRASEMIPLCHPLTLDQVLVWFDLDADTLSVVASCEASSTAKTGVEMEALCGVSGALLAIYDLAKAVDPALTIADIRLNEKVGGKSGHWIHPSHAAPKGNGRTPPREIAKAQSGLPVQPSAQSGRAASERPPLLDAPTPIRPDEGVDDPVRVRVQLFGAFRKYSNGDDVSLDVPRGTTVSALRGHLIDTLRREYQCPEAQDLVRTSVLAAESHILEESQQVGCAGGEVVLAVLPPVCGG